MTTHYATTHILALIEILCKQNASLRSTANMHLTELLEQVRTCKRPPPQVDADSSTCVDLLECDEPIYLYQKGKAETCVSAASALLGSFCNESKQSSAGLFQYTSSSSAIVQPTARSVPPPPTQFTDIMPVLLLNDVGFDITSKTRSCLCCGLPSPAKHMYEYSTSTEASTATCLLCWMCNVRNEDAKHQLGSDLQGMLIDAMQY